MRPIDYALTDGPVTAEQRAYAVDVLRSTRDALHQSVAGLTDAQLAYRPAPGQWTIAENVEHIVLVEEGIFTALKAGLAKPADPAKRAEIRVSDVDVVKAVRSRSVRLPAPAPFVPTGRFGNVAATLRAFDAHRQLVVTFAEDVADDLRTHYFRHFVLGRLDSFQALLLIAAHGERHRKQIEEIKANAGFLAT